MPISQVAFDFADDLPVADTITAHGETLYVAEWAKRLGMSEDTLRKRLANGWDPEKAVTAPKQVTNRSVDLRRQVPDGAPGSWTWYDLPYERDPWAQEFVKAHPDGASMEEVGAAMGVEVSWICEIEQGAVAKLLAKLKQVRRGEFESLNGQLALVGGRGNAAEIDLAAHTMVELLEDKDEAARWLAENDNGEREDDEYELTEDQDGMWSTDQDEDIGA